MTVETSSIAANVRAVEERIVRAAERAGRDPATITLVAVSKTMPADRVQAAYDVGVRHFGENRVHEGQLKVDALQLRDATWHLIGHLQTNKARVAARSFGVVHSVDSERVAAALSQEAVKSARQLDVLIEVNYAAEESKFGMAPGDTAGLARIASALPGLRLVGLMTVAPFVEEAEEVRPVFRGMRQMSERVRGDLGSPENWQLSMGMTNDFEVAIEEGATIVRVGRAIFGERL